MEGITTGLGVATQSGAQHTPIEAASVDKKKPKKEVQMGSSVMGRKAHRSKTLSVHTKISPDKVFDR